MSSKTVSPAAWACAALLLASCSGARTEHRQTPVAPGVSGLSPDFGPPSGGTFVTIFGRGFETGAEVLVGGTPATGITCVDSMTVTCTTPAGAPGPADVSVGGMVLPGGFTYTTWPLPGWTRRAPIAVSGTAAGALTDFQVRVTVPYDADMNPDFSDLRFSQEDSGAETLIPHWFEAVTSSTEALAWVRVPSIPASPGSAALYAYYGRPDAASSSDFDRTFTKDLGAAGLKTLWHLDEGAGGTAADASGNGVDAALAAFPAGFGWLPDDGGGWGTRADAGFSSGSALSFDGASATLAASYDPAMDLGAAFTVEAWVKADAAGGAARRGAILSRSSLAGDRFTTPSSWSRVDPGPIENLWDPGPSMPAALERAASAVLGSKIYVCGGVSGAAASNVLLEYDPATETWTARASLAAARSRHGLAAAGGKLYAVGGTADGTTAISTGTVEEYDPGADTWAARAEMPNPRMGLGCCALNGLVYAVGGLSTVLHADVDRYDPSTDTWTASPADLAVPLRDLGCAEAGGRIYAAGGFNGTVPVSAFGEYEPVANAWTPLAALPGGPRYRASVAAASGKVHVLGGNSGSAALRRVESYDVAGLAWSAGTDLLRPRDASAAALVNNRLHVCGGTGIDGSDVEVSGGLDGRGFDPDGFFGAAFDGRYLYLVPEYDGAGPSGEVVRFDTAGGFGRTSSWAAFDPSAQGVGVSPKGCRGALFDGRYVYFPPHDNGSPHGEVLRYDTTAAFDAAASWSAYDPGAKGLGVDPD
ncbi:MAG: DUF2341 domain-containing protein, partial [Planctomycetes bacterium]|nr:DUF2341 domain-containing protein [Planctomycetota bacterium]